MLILETSRNESSVLTPGGGAFGSRGWGGGGGDGHGEDEVVDGDGDALGEDDGEGDGGGVKGPVAPGTTAAFLNSSIFSLCFSFNSAISLTPSFCALDASLSLYLDKILSSVPWVAIKRMSCTRAHRRWLNRGLDRG